MIEVELPFVYDAWTRQDRRFRLRRHRVVGWEPMLLGDEHDNLVPACWATTLDDVTLIWYQHGEYLFRPVLRDGQPVPLLDLLDGHALVTPPNPEEWFDDHPSALHVLHRRPTDLSAHSYFLEHELPGEVVGTNRADRLEETRRLYRRCIVIDGHVLRPAPAPTWSVAVSDGLVSLAMEVGLRPPPGAANYHFGIQDHDLALAFFLAMGGTENDAPGRTCGLEAGVHGSEGGALPTAWSMAELFHPVLGGVRVGDLDTRLIRIMGELIDLHHHGDDHGGDQALLNLEKLPVEILPLEVHSAMDALRCRRRLLLTRMESDLDGFVIPP